jgi:hypothetical protein
MRRHLLQALEQPVTLFAVMTFKESGILFSYAGVRSLKDTTANCYFSEE